MAVSPPRSEAEVQPGGVKCSGPNDHGCGGGGEGRLIPKKLYTDLMVKAWMSLLKSDALPKAPPHGPIQAAPLGVSSGLTD